MLFFSKRPVYVAAAAADRSKLGHLMRSAARSALGGGLVLVFGHRIRRLLETNIFLFLSLRTRQCDRKFPVSAVVFSAERHFV